MEKINLFWERNRNLALFLRDYGVVDFLGHIYFVIFLIIAKNVNVIFFGIALIFFFIRSFISISLLNISTSYLNPSFLRKHCRHKTEKFFEIKGTELLQKKLLDIKSILFDVKFLYFFASQFIVEFQWHLLNTVIFFCLFELSYCFYTEIDQMLKEKK